MISMHGTNNSTAMKFYPTTTSGSIHDERAVTYINFCVHRRSSIIELISSNHFIIFGIDLEEAYSNNSHKLILAMVLSIVQIRWLC